MLQWRLKPILVMLTILIFVFVQSLPLPSQVQVGPRKVDAASFTLFGRILAPAGWGFTSSSISSPGPDLVVDPGDTVTLALASSDGIGHNFGVDYNGNGIRDGSEPQSATFISSIPFTFVATTVPGTYKYYCFIHGAPMIGNFIVRPSFKLYGRVNITFGPAGWGFSPSTISSPGPDLIIAPGTTVTVNLTSSDNLGHNFGVDYNGNGFRDGSEPQSPSFGSGVIFTFVATTTPGTYTYYCFIHGTPMDGNFIVAFPHDVAVSGILTSRSDAYAGVTSNPAQVNVTASNVGQQPENFFVWAKANTTLIGNQTVSVPAGQTRIVSFQWTTSTLTRGNYLLTAQATAVPGDGNTANNVFSGGVFKVKLNGDVNGDCLVDVTDLVGVTGVWHSTIPGLAADQNNDKLVDVSDLVLVTGHWHQIC